jgi:hypothetical protein
VTTFQLLLLPWQAYFQTTAECAATLTGLMFVVVSQGVLKFDRGAMSIVRTFLNPILGYYIGSLVISALFCMPDQTPFRLGCELTIALVMRGRFLMSAMAELRAFHRKEPLTHSKLLHHFFLPASVVPVCLVSILLIGSAPTLTLDLLSFTVLVSLVAGILEAWRLTLMLAEMDPEEMKRIHALYGETLASARSGLEQAARAAVDDAGL